MKKTKSAFLIALSLTTLVSIVLFSFKTDVKTPIKKIVVDEPCSCYYSPNGDLYNVGCPSSCNSNFSIYNINTTITGGVVHFNTLYFCYMGSGSAPWSSSTLLGTLTPSLRPSTTRIFTASNTGGHPVECIIYPNGEWYIRHTATTPSGNSCSISGSYSL